jgi:hypothetical protein
MREPLDRDFPFGLSLEPLQAYFGPHFNIAPPPLLAPGEFFGIFRPESLRETWPGGCRLAIAA